MTDQTDRTLYLIDAYAVIYRGFFAMAKMARVTSTGINTTATLGFCNKLQELLRDHDPSHIAVCFDPAGPTFRKEEYADYKANRDKQPEAITEAIPYIKRIIEASGIRIVQVDGYEADDVIGTLAHKAEAEGYTVYMVTPDKDYAQLVTDRCLMLNPYPSKAKEKPSALGPEGIKQYYGVRPDQIADWLALVGDSSDNIPGCPGVGKVTAAKLLDAHDTLAGVLDAAQTMTGKTGQSLRDHAEQIRFSRHLATICTDAPLGDVTPDSLLRRPEDTDKLIEVYTELEFKSFLAKLRPAKQPQGSDMGLGGLFDLPCDSPAPAAEQEPQYAETPEQTARLVKRLCDSRATVGVALLGWPPEAGAVTAMPRMLGLADSHATCTIVPLDGPDVRDTLAVLEPLFTSPDVTLVSLDYKYILVKLATMGIHATASFADVRIEAYLLDPDGKNSPGTLARKYLHTEMPESLDKPIKTERDLQLMAMLALRLLGPVRDAYAALDDGGATQRILNEVELPLLPVLAQMELTGVRVDLRELAALSGQLSGQLEQMEEEIYSLAGKRFNIYSPAQVGQVLFGDLDISGGKVAKGKSGNYSTTEAILSKYAAEHPIVDLVLRCRGLRKLLSTYIDALPEAVDPRDGKIHTTFNQAVTATGRISSANPNIQNIPVRTELGREIRRAFVPDPGCVMLSADYSQIELRLMSDFSGDPVMVDTFMHGGDIHRTTAAKVYHTEPEEVTPDQRRKAKTANFGIIYGISSFGLAERLRIPRAEAKELIDGYFASYPEIRRYIDYTVAKAHDNGYVTTPMGRRRYLADIDSRNAALRSYAERNAVNAPLQGAAADIIKVAMIRIAKRIEETGLRSRMILQVHDELVFNVLPDELDTLKAMVIEEMEHAYSGKVPMEVSAGVAANWLEAH